MRNPRSRASVQPGDKHELAVFSKFLPCCCMLAFKMESVNKAGHLMSLAALQQYDPYINKLLDVTGQVALYKFNSKANEWVRSCFYSAAAAGIVIFTGTALANISQGMLHGCMCLPCSHIRAFK